MSSSVAGVLAVAALALSPLSAHAGPASENASGSSRKVEEGSPVIARVSFKSREDLNQLAETLDLSAAVDNEKQTVEALLTAEQYEALRKSGRRVEILEEQTALLN